MGLLGVLRPHREQTQVPVGTFRERLGFTNPNGTNGMLVQAFYPAEANGSPLTQEMPLIRDEVLSSIHEFMGIPLWAMRSLVGGYAQLDPPLPPAQPKAVEKWPIAVFSSGLMGSCEMYTQFCRDLAAQGMIVLALEHEDGSGIHATTSAGSRVAYVRPPKGATTKEFRRPFLEFRRTELAAATDAILGLAKGQATDSKRSPLAEVLGMGDASDLVLLAHSFGAAGSLYYLRELAESEPAKCPYRLAVLLDLWTEPLPPAMLEGTPPVPIALVLSEEWAEKFTRMRDGNLLVSKSAQDSCLATLKVRGTTHQWISETQLLLPAFLLRKAGVMGSGAFARVHQATLRSIQLLNHASAREPGAGGEEGPEEENSGLRERLARVDPEVVQFM